MCLVAVSSGASSSPESRYPPRRLDGATHTCWCASTGTAATSRHSDDGRHDEEDLPSQLDPIASTSTSTLQRQQSQQQQQPQTQQQQQQQQQQPPHHHHHHHPHHHRSSRDEGEPPPGRCPSCGQKRRIEISYTIEDLDAIEPAPLESQRTPTQRTCSCDVAEAPRAAERERGDLRKYRSTDSRWGDSSFLSPDDAIWDLKKRTTEGTEFRWELHTSNTDLDLAKKTKCSYHSLTPEEKKPHDIQRGDLRKHHSAETDKWSVKVDYLQPPMHDLRKHSSDDTRMAREARFLQVPEVLPNPKPRCTCPKSKILSPSPPATVAAPVPAPAPAPAPVPTKVKTPSPKPAPVLTLPPPPPVSELLAELEQEKELEKALPAAVVTLKEPERKLYHSASLNVERPLPELPVAAAGATAATLAPTAERPELKKHASEDTRLVRRDRPKLERSHARVDSQASRKWGAKEKVASPEEGKKPRPRWALKPHFSLPVEEKKSRWRSQESTEGFKSKSLKERPKYSIRRSMSPEPDPRQMSKLDNRIVRRLISPEIMIAGAKWAPYENDSPLPKIGVKKREPAKHISEIKWTPYEGSPPQDEAGVGSVSFALPEPEETKSWSPFHNVTPTHHPPPEATPCRSDDEDFRWRILNQVSAFPIYQVPASPVKRQRSQQQYSPQPQPQPPPQQQQQQQRKSISKLRGLSKKKPFGSRARSESGRQPPQPPAQAEAGHRHPEERPAPPTVIVRAASEEPKRQRPQLTRSKALLEVPVPAGIGKRSLSEEVPRARGRDRPRAPHRARSEEAPRYDDPWYAKEGGLARQSTELREYVTTV
ncbi:cdk5 activator-like protein isoform X2 [Augochlora pura]